jgi:hypothetical protein
MKKTMFLRAKSTRFNALKRRLSFVRKKVNLYMLMLLNLFSFKREIFCDVPQVDQNGVVYDPKTGRTCC